jgi:hypothetical protein
LTPFTPAFPSDVLKHLSPLRLPFRHPGKTDGVIIDERLETMKRRGEKLAAKSKKPAGFMQRAFGV